MTRISSEFTPTFVLGLMHRSFFTICLAASHDRIYWKAVSASQQYLYAYLFVRSSRCWSCIVMLFSCTALSSFNAFDIFVMILVMSVVLSFSIDSFFWLIVWKVVVELGCEGVKAYFPVSNDFLCLLKSGWPFICSLRWWPIALAFSCTCISRFFFIKFIELLHEWYIFIFCCVFELLG